MALAVAVMNRTRIATYLSQLQVWCPGLSSTEIFSLNKNIISPGFSPVSISMTIDVVPCHL